MIVVFQDLQFHELTQLAAGVEHSHVHLLIRERRLKPLGRVSRMDRLLVSHQGDPEYDHRLETSKLTDWHGIRHGMGYTVCYFLLKFATSRATDRLPNADSK